MRILKLAFQNLGRNFWLSATNIITIGIMLFSLSLLGSINILSQKIINSWQGKMDLTIYLKPNSPETRMALLRSEIENAPETKEIRYINPDEALKQFKARHKNDPLIIKSLKRIERNPLGAAINVKFYNPSDYKKILTIIEKPSYKEFIQGQDFVNFEKLIDIFNKFNKKIHLFILVISGIFIFITILIIFNTIKLGIYARRDEIKIMRLVGATSAFIRGPFLAESCLIAFFGWILSWTISIPLFILSQPYINRLTDLNIQATNILKENGVYSLIILLFFGLLISTLSSLLATKKYLKV